MTIHTSNHTAQSDPKTGRRTLLIADRELPVRVGLRTILAGEPGIIATSASSTIAELTALAGQHPAALILMDTRFSDGDGIEACRTLLSQHHRLRVLFFAGAPLPQLSPRHQQILPLLSEGLTNKEISAQQSPPHDSSRLAHRFWKRARTRTPDTAELLYAHSSAY